MSRDARSEPRSSDRGRLASAMRPWAGLTTLAATTLLLVLVVPWFIPMRMQAHASDSQLVGFNNRAAVVGLFLAMILASVAGFAWRGGREMRSFVLRDRVDRTDRVPWWLVAFISAASVAVVVALGWTQRSFPVADDARYFADRLLYLINGGLPYRDFEFSYGPVLLYPQYLLWRAFAPLGVSPWAAYYAWLALTRIIGVLMLSFIVNRVRLPKHLRLALFAIIGAFAAWQPSLGLNYSLLRFCTPFALILLVMSLDYRHAGRHFVAVASLGAAVLAFAVSPEMGVAVAAALVAAFGFTAIRADARDWWVVAALVGGAAVGAVVASGQSTFVSFLGGSDAFPILPGPPALVYILGALVLALGAGAIMRTEHPSDAKPVLAWATATLVLSMAALGRADFGHIFWNGLGILIAVPAVLSDQRLNLARAYVIAAAAIFLSLLGLLTPFYVSQWRWSTAEQASQPSAEQISELVRAPGVFAPMEPLRGPLGLALAESHKLVSVFGTVTVDSLALRPGPVYLLYSQSEYQSIYGPTVNPKPVSTARAPSYGSPYLSVLLGYPSQLAWRTSAPMTDAIAKADSVARSWVVVHQVFPSWVVLGKK